MTMQRKNRSTLLFVAGIALLLAGLTALSARDRPPACESCHVQGVPRVEAGREPHLPPNHPSLHRE
jgi:hypothetical protein